MYRSRYYFVGWLSSAGRTDKGAAADSKCKHLLTLLSEMDETAGEGEIGSSDEEDGEEKSSAGDQSLEYGEDENGIQYGIPATRK
ncbi:hypothetical protein EON64_08650 [archaeon]|nr:MAG: hypothetical protein EON64_08650 [archaeon]